MPSSIVKNENLGILFDAYWYHKGPPSQRHVMREMIEHWKHEYPEDRIGLLVRRKHITHVREEVGDEFLLYPTNLWPHALTVIFESWLAKSGFRPDIVLSHNFASPFTRRSVVFIHDFLFVDHPEWFSRMERIYFSLMPITARSASLILTSSAIESTRIRSHLPHKHVLPVGIGMSMELVTSIADANISTRLNIVSGSFDLTVGRLNIRKNLAMTIKASLASGRATPSHPLVIVGEKDGRSETLDEEILLAVDAGAVVFAGFVSDAELKWLYSNAALFIFASLGEGFGMPPVEATYLGCPTVVSDLAIFHETLGETAQYVDTSDLASFVSALENIESGVQDSHSPASRLSWKTIVRSIRSSIVTLGI